MASLALSFLLFVCYGHGKKIEPNPFLAAIATEKAANIISRPELSNTVTDNLSSLYQTEKKRILGDMPKQNISKKLHNDVDHHCKKQNKAVLNLLRSNTKQQQMPGKPLPELKKISAQIIKTINESPIMNQHQVHQKYDQTGQIGFCFGRSAFVHLELLRLGVAPVNTAKIFALGTLYFKDLFWEFHMATMVRDQQNKWYVIDDLTEGFLPVEQWMKQIHDITSGMIDHHLRFYTTGATKFLPTSGAYNDKVLFNPIYKGFFREFIQWYPGFRSSENHRSKGKEHNLGKSKD